MFGAGLRSEHRENASAAADVEHDLAAQIRIRCACVCVCARERCDVCMCERRANRPARQQAHERESARAKRRAQRATRTGERSAIAARAHLVLQHLFVNACASHVSASVARAAPQQKPRDETEKKTNKHRTCTLRTEMRIAVEVVICARLFFLFLTDNIFLFLHDACGTCERARKKKRKKNTNNPTEGTDDSSSG